MNIESKKIAINTSAKMIYDFVGNFNNFSNLLPAQVEGWASTEDTCSFKVGGFVQIQLRMAEKIPYSRKVQCEKLNILNVLYVEILLK